MHADLHLLAATDSQGLRRRRPHTLEGAPSQIGARRAAALAFAPGGAA